MNEVDFIQDILLLSEKSRRVQAGLSEVILRNDARIRCNRKSAGSHVTTSTAETIKLHDENRVLSKYILDLESQIRTFKQLLSATPKSSEAVNSNQSDREKRVSLQAFLADDGREAWEKKLHNDDTAHPVELTNKVKRLERSLEENSILISKLRSKNKAMEEEVTELRDISAVDDPTRLNSGMALLMEEILKLRQKLGSIEGGPGHVPNRKELKLQRKTRGSVSSKKSPHPGQYTSRAISSNTDMDRTEQLENEVEILVLRVKELQEQNESLSRSSQALMSQNADQSEDSEEILLLRAELDKSRKEAASAQKFSLDLQKRLQKLRNENVQKLRDDDLTRLVETLSTRNSTLTEQLKQRETKMKENAEERRELKETNLELNDAITRLSEQIYKTERERDMNMKWRSIANDRGADVNRLAQENATLRNEGIGENNQLRRTIQSLETEMNYMRVEMTGKEEALKEALRIHEEREEYLEKTRHERSNQTASAGMLQSMMEENRRLEERSKAAEEEAETLRSFMEAKRGDRANESKAIGVLKLGLSKEQEKNRNLNKEIQDLIQSKKDLVADNQRLREKVNVLTAAGKGDASFMLTSDSVESKELKKQLVDKENELFNLSRELQHAREELVRTRKQWEESKGNISVMVRVKPAERDEEEVVECDTTTVSIPDDVFSFEKVFSQYSTQSDLFEEVKEVADMCLEGEKVAVIAMGATQTGKSFTLLGERKQHGVIPRCIQYFLNTTQELSLNNGDHYSVQATFLGISDGEIYDLFALNAMKVRSPSDARRINFEENNLQLHKIFEAVGMETHEHASRVFTIYVQCDSENGSFSSSMSFFDMDAEARSQKVLLDCLSGRAKALLLMHVDPSARALQQTTSALRFADKAQNVHMRLSMSMNEEEAEVMKQEMSAYEKEYSEGEEGRNPDQPDKAYTFTHQNEFILHM